MMFKRNRRMHSGRWVMNAIGLACAYFIGREYGKRMHNSRQNNNSSSEMFSDKSDYPTEI